MKAKPESEKIRVIVADDSALMRRILSSIVSGDPELELLATARDGEDIIKKARELKPDVVTMDINMPKCDGITALQVLTNEKLCSVIMVSSLTQRGALTTFEALELGAFDYVAKPDGTVSSGLNQVSDELVTKIKWAARAGTVAKLARRKNHASSEIQCPPMSGKPMIEDKAVAIGISTGGPSTLSEVLPEFPADFPAPIFLVQHMPAKFIPEFAKRLDRQCRIKVVQAESGMVVQPGICYIAKGSCQLSLLRRLNNQVVLRTPTYPQTLFMPSVSQMMKSVHAAYGAKTIGVLMTGIGDDGADMMVEIFKSGGHTIAESDETAVVFGMPRRAIELGGARVVAPSYKIAEEILKAF